MPEDLSTVKRSPKFARKHALRSGMAFWLPYGESNPIE